MADEQFGMGGPGIGDWLAQELFPQGTAPFGPGTFPPMQMPPPPAQQPPTLQYQAPPPPGGAIPDWLMPRVDISGPMVSGKKAVYPRAGVGMDIPIGGGTLSAEGGYKHARPGKDPDWDWRLGYTRKF
jgi:hypothetical protein